MKTINASVHGSIHGVGFRYFVLRCALSCQIRGFIKNEQDGTMTIKASGDEDDINTFLAKIEDGNGFSKVDFMAVNVIGNEELREFRVIY